VDPQLRDHPYSIYTPLVAGLATDHAHCDRGGGSAYANVAAFDHWGPFLGNNAPLRKSYPRTAPIGAQVLITESRYYSNNRMITKIAARNDAVFPRRAGHHAKGGAVLTLFLRFVSIHGRLLFSIAATAGSKARLAWKGRAASGGSSPVSGCCGVGGFSPRCAKAYVEIAREEELAAERNAGVPRRDTIGRLGSNIF